MDLSTIGFKDLEHLANCAAAEVQSRISAAALEIDGKYGTHTRPACDPGRLAAALVALREGSDNMINKAITTGEIAYMNIFEGDVLAEDPFAGNDAIRRLREGERAPAPAVDLNEVKPLLDGLKHHGAVTQAATLAAHFNAQIPRVADDGHLPVDRIAFEQSLAACRVAGIESLEDLRKHVVSCLGAGDVGGAAKALTFAGVVCNGRDIRIGAANFVTLATKGKKRPFMDEWAPVAPEEIAHAAEVLARDCWACLALVGNEITERDPEARRALEEVGG